jgi:hypothetical protein
LKARSTLVTTELVRVTLKVTEFPRSLVTFGGGSGGEEHRLAFIAFVNDEFSPPEMDWNCVVDTANVKDSPLVCSPIEGVAASAKPTMMRTTLLVPAKAIQASFPRRPER